MVLKNWRQAKSSLKIRDLSGGDQGLSFGVADDEKKQVPQKII